MESFKDYLPYIVSVLVALITSFASYFAAERKCRTDIKSLEESNAHEINRLMEQHKLDINSLERKHEMEMEKMELKHKHQLELKSKEFENAMSNELINTLVKAAMQTPEARQAFGQAFQGKATGRRKR